MSNASKTTPVRHRKERYSAMIAKMVLVSGVRLRSVEPRHRTFASRSELVGHRLMARDSEFVSSCDIW